MITVFAHTHPKMSSLAALLAIVGYRRPGDRLDCSLLYLSRAYGLGWLSSDETKLGSWVFNTRERGGVAALRPQRCRMMTTNQAC